MTRHIDSTDVLRAIMAAFPDVPHTWTDQRCHCQGCNTPFPACIGAACSMCPTLCGPCEETYVPTCSDCGDDLISDDERKRESCDVCYEAGLRGQRDDRRYEEEAGK